MPIKNTNEIEKRLAYLESKINQHKYYITLLMGGAVLKRDLSTNEIEYIDSFDDEYESLMSQYDDAILVDLFCIEDWEPIPIPEPPNKTNNKTQSEYDKELYEYKHLDKDYREGIKNNPEKCWILLHMHPECKTAKGAWKLEVSEYKKYLDEVNNVINSKSELPSINHKEVSINNNKSKPIKPIEKPETPQQRVDRIKQAIAEEFGEFGFYTGRLL